MQFIIFLKTMHLQTFFFPLLDMNYTHTKIFSFLSKKDFFFIIIIITPEIKKEIRF